MSVLLVIFLFTIIYGSHGEFSLSFWIVWTLFMIACFCVMIKESNKTKRNSKKAWEDYEKTWGDYNRRKQEDGE